MYIYLSIYLSISRALSLSFSLFRPLSRALSRSLCLSLLLSLSRSLSLSLLLSHSLSASFCDWEFVTVPGPGRSSEPCEDLASGGSPSDRRVFSGAGGAYRGWRLPGAPFLILLGTSA